MNVERPTSSVSLRLVAVRHSQVRHLVQSRATDQQLRGLSIKAPRRSSPPEDQLEAKDCCFSQRAPMIVALFLPSGASNSSNPSQILIASQTFTFGVGALPNLGIASRWDRSLRLPLSNCLITITFVVSAVAGNLIDLCIHLIQQLRQHLAIRVIIGRDHCRQYFSTALIDAQMHFAPSATVGITVLADFPFTFAKDFHPGAINHQMHWFVSVPTKQLDLQSRPPSRERRKF